MILDIVKAKKFIGKEFKLKKTFELPSDILQSFAVKPLGVGAIDGTYVVKDLNTCLINAVATIFLQATCFRCGEAFTFKYSFNICEKFVTSPVEEEYKLDNTSVNLSSPITDNFLTQFPSQLLCNKNCKGLCQYCGINFNYSNCDCEANKAEENSPFAILKQLK